MAGKGKGRAWEVGVGLQEMESSEGSVTLVSRHEAGSGVPYDLSLASASASARSAQNKNAYDRESQGVSKETMSSPVQAHDMTGKLTSTVYDAVAGRVGYEGFLCNHGGYEGKPLRPDEVLFRSKQAPQRYAENDVYFANRHLSDDQHLPSSDLLKAIHAYTADFYGAMKTDEGNVEDFKSLDETALLAIGILLEEAAYAELDEDGDKVFAEINTASNTT